MADPRASAISGDETICDAFGLPLVIGKVIEASGTIFVVMVRRVSASEECAMVGYGEALIRATGLSMNSRFQPPNRARS